MLGTAGVGPCGAHEQPWRIGASGIRLYEMSGVCVERLGLNLLSPVFRTPQLTCQSRDDVAAKRRV